MFDAVTVMFEYITFVPIALLIIGTVPDNTQVVEFTLSHVGLFAEIEQVNELSEFIHLPVGV